MTSLRCWSSSTLDLQCTGASATAEVSQSAAATLSDAGIRSGVVGRGGKTAAARQHSRHAALASRSTRMLYVSAIWQACNAEEAEHHSALAQLLQALAALVHAARAAADLQEAVVGVAISFMTLLSGSDLLARSVHRCSAEADVGQPAAATRSDDGILMFVGSRGGGAAGARSVCARDQRSTIGPRFTLVKK